MKYLSLLITIFLLTIKTFEASAQFPAWQWAVNAGRSAKDIHVAAVATDAGNDIYIVGDYSDIGIIGYDTLAYEDGRHVFMAKYSRSGAFLWAKKLSGGYGYQQPTAMCIDKSGNINIAGNIRFSYGVFGGDTLKYRGGTADVFVAKIDPWGNVLWARSAGGKNMDDLTFGMTTDSKGNVYISGQFSDTCYFDSARIYTAHVSENYFAKYSTVGKLQWLKNVHSQWASGGTQMVTDKWDNIYATGYITDSAYFDTVMLRSTNTSGYLARMDTAGNIKWAVPIGSKGPNDKTIGFTLSVDAQSYVNVCGTFEDSLNFGTFNLYRPVNSTAGFIARYDSNGTVQWANLIPQTQNYGEPTVTDNAGNIYTAGESDTALCKYNSAGTFLGRQNIEGRYNHSSVTQNAICRDSYDNIIIAGDFDHSLNFGNISISITGANGIFLAKLPAWTLSVPKPGNNNPPDIGISPNPANDMLYVSLNGNLYTTLKLYDQLGRMVSCVRISQTMMQQIDISALSSGIYYLEASGAEIAPQMKKVIVQK